MSAIFASLLLVTAVNAKVLPREEARKSSMRDPASFFSATSLPFEDPETTISNDFPTPTTIFDPSTTTMFPNFTFTEFPSVSFSSPDFSGTFFIPIPSQADYLSVTVPACTQADGEVVDSIVVIGVPTGTFSPGITKTIVVPPQANPTTATFYDYPPNNDTEVVIVEPLPGNCGPFITPTNAFAPTGTESSAEPSNTAAACPTKGCSGAVLRAAETVINAINDVTQISFALQTGARKIGAGIFGRDDVSVNADVDLFSNPITDVALGLTRITTTVQTALPTFITFPPFPPSCSSDTIVLAWLEFVRVHQELLAILIGRSGLLETGPLKRSSVVNHADGTPITRGEQGFVGRPIAVALRGIEGVVDTLAVGIADLVPGKSECSEKKSAELKEKIKKAQMSYEG
ncbi:hypothetical protein DPSP01_010217 [Paraphaeosphaeria sporulosa]|uniref:Uncharacterized protein n=1 Tax=Paraphaeosphaeria sporulosa TaxID=1460663 RepID=A0A177C8P7_9PLEO|nr:uncharacterized protein CC84DRAFT_960216 [Paraphaeosphaeria sporulosa]OAG03148.1 hypothetical protein CC84DRAFT_960216 [Paraphaeosphaeria sporulosa]